MRVTRLELRDFRNYEAAELELPAGLDGRGRAERRRQDEPARGASTSAAPARSPRTSNERELVRRGADGRAGGGRDPRRGRAPTGSRSGFEPGEAKRLRVDGSAVEQPVDTRRAPARERLPARAARAREGRPGGPAGAPRPARRRALARPRRRTRGAYSRALAQRNALLGRIRAGLAGPGALDAWDAELARAGDRADGGPRRGRRRPAGSRSRALAGRARPAGRRPSCATGRARDAARRATGSRPSSPSGAQADLERGFTAHGPHRDELAAAARRRPAARLRLAGPAAGRPARAAVRRARAAGRAPRPPAADAARRRDVRARRRAPRAARRAAARRRPGAGHRDRGRARAGRRTSEELRRGGQRRDARAGRSRREAPGAAPARRPRSREVVGAARAARACSRASRRPGRRSPGRRWRRPRRPSRSATGSSRSRASRRSGRRSSSCSEPTSWGA